MTRISRRLVFLMLLVCVTAVAAGEPQLLESGSMITNEGWKLSFSTVAKPPVSDQHNNIVIGMAKMYARSGSPTVFHRFFGDDSTKTCFGYDVIVEPGGSSAKMRFQPLSVLPEQLIREFQPGNSRFIPIREFPGSSFESGQTIAITLFTNPATGQKVVDYLRLDEATYFERIAQFVEERLVDLKEVPRRFFTKR